MAAAGFGFAVLANATSSMAAVTGKHAAFVVDANTGEVLFGEHETELRYPASLTKMMTLYMVFERIEDGRLTYGSKITASNYASARPPSKIGLKPGDTITVRDAVRALVTKSANDVASAVAEHLAGSESGFARLMTRKARQLGMNNTVFRNASGLPDSEQVTTARDMAQLALRLRDHFPNHYYNFKTREFRHRGKRYRNHNGLLGRHRGVDGIKTGYTRASGFNLVTSLRTGGKDVVAVVMGGKTGRARNATMRRLLTKYVPSASTTRTRQRNIRVPMRRIAPRRPRSTPNVAAAPRWQPPTIRRAQRPAVLPRRQAPPPTRSADTAAGPRIRIAQVRAVDIFARNRQRAPAARAQTTTAQRPAFIPNSRIQQRERRAMQPGTLQAQAARLAAPAPSSQAITFGAPAPARSAAAGTTPSALGGTVSASGPHIQVGAFATPGEAHRQLELVAGKAGSILHGARPLAISAMSGNRRVFRARYAGFGAKRAGVACTSLRRIGIDCFVARSE